MRAFGTMAPTFFAIVPGVICWGFARKNSFVGQRKCDAYSLSTFALRPHATELVLLFAKDTTAPDSIAQSTAWPCAGVHICGVT
jgi:hypothetical protein